MTNEDRLILELCKSSASDDVIISLLRRENIDWSYFFHITAEQEVAPLVLSRLLEYPLPPGADDLLRTAAKREIVAAAVTRSTMLAELRRIRGALEREGIEFILLKGLSLDFSELRTMKDLDILVREDRYIEAIRALGTIDYEFVGQYRTALMKRGETRMLLAAIGSPVLDEEKRGQVLSALRWNNHYPVFSAKTNLLVEIHSNLFESRRLYTEQIDGVLENVALFWREKRYDSTLDCYTLSNEHALLLMGVHLAIKRSPANNMFVLKLACDIDGLIRRGIRWEHFIEAVSKMRVEPFILYALLQTQQLLATPLAGGWLRRLEKRCTKAQLLLIRIHLKCLRSLDSYRLVYSKVYTICKAFVFESRPEQRLRWIFLIPILFPSKRRMAAIFNIREDSPFLYLTYLINPFRWIVLIVRSTLRWKNESNI